MPAGSVPPPSAARRSPARRRSRSHARATHRADVVLNASFWQTSKYSKSATAIVERRRQHPGGCSPRCRRTSAGRSDASCSTCDDGERHGVEPAGQTIANRRRDSASSARSNAGVRCCRILLFAVGITTTTDGIGAHAWTRDAGACYESPRRSAPLANRPGVWFCFPVCAQRNAQIVAIASLRHRPFGARLNGRCPVTPTAPCRRTCACTAGRTADRPRRTTRCRSTDSPSTWRRAAASCRTGS